MTSLPPFSLSSSQKLKIPKSSPLSHVIYIAATLSLHLIISQFRQQTLPLYPSVLGLPLNLVTSLSNSPLPLLRGAVAVSVCRHRRAAAAGVALCHHVPSVSPSPSRSALAARCCCCPLVARLLIGVGVVAVQSPIAASAQRRHPPPPLSLSPSVCPSLLSWRCTAPSSRCRLRRETAGVVSTSSLRSSSVCPITPLPWPVQVYAVIT